MPRAHAGRSGGEFVRTMDSVQHYAGPKARLPILTYRTIGLVTDAGAEELLAGFTGGNVLLASRRATGGEYETLVADAASVTLIVTDNVKTPILTITAQTAGENAGNGTIFEDTDGKLKYKNLAGEIIPLTNDIPEGEI